MASKILHKRSATASNIPTAGSLDYGELAINYADEKLYIKNSSDQVVEVGAGGGSGISNVVEDTTPQLGGTLDANGNVIDMGTNNITDTKVGQWDTAYSWGDHGTAGYLTTVTASNVDSTGATNGYVLTANGSGAAAWVAASGGSGGGLFTEGTSGVWSTASITSATVDGDFIATGDITSNSDERLKENIEPVTSALSIVDSINGVYFNLKANPEKRHVGVIAQNIETVLPEVIVEDADGIKSVAYGNVVGVLIEAIKELKAEIEELKNGI